MAKRKKYNMVSIKRLHRYYQVLMVLGYLCKLNGKNYCFPSQDKIVELLEKKYGVSYSRRHLNRILNGFEEGGYFRRIRRMQKGKDGGLIKNSSLYLLTSKAFKILGKMGFFLKGFVKGITKKIRQATEQEKKTFDPFSMPHDKYIEYLKKVYEKEREKNRENLRKKFEFAKAIF